MTKKYLGHFEYFATGEGATTFLWVFNVEAAEDRDIKFYEKLCGVAGWHKTPDTSKDPGFSYFKVGFDFYDIEDAEGLKELKKEGDNLPVRFEVFKHIWYIQDKFKGAPNNFLYHSYVNVF